MLDAVVFFSAAIVVSSALLQYLDDSLSEDQLPDPGRQPDADEILRVFLRSSIGVRLDIVLDCAYTFPEESTFIELLQLEAIAVEQGFPQSRFEDADSTVDEALARMVGPLHSHHLSCMALDGETSEMLFAIPSLAPASGNIIASSQLVPGLSGEGYLVQLQLAPHLLPELVAC